MSGQRHHMQDVGHHTGPARGANMPQVMDVQVHQSRALACPAPGRSQGIVGRSGNRRLGLLAIECAQGSQGLQRSIRQGHRTFAVFGVSQHQDALCPVHVLPAGMAQWL